MWILGVSILITGCTGSDGELNPKDSDGGGTEVTSLPPLVVNEFMADNAKTILDDRGQPSDWIELYNAGDDDITLAGYRLTDDFVATDRFVFGDLLIPARGFLLLWADGETDAGPLHLSFSLERQGESIGLYSPDGDALDLLEYQEQAEDRSAARYPDGSEESGAWSIVESPTPGETNAGSG
jgi:hypothetical protein